MDRPPKKAKKPVAKAHDRAALLQLRSLSLAAKVRMSINRIRQWHETNDGAIYVGYSGGRDSGVVGHLVRSVYPDVPFVFHDSAMEFPENRQQARDAGAEFTTPAMTPKEVFAKYGYPVVSKRTAQYLYEAREYRKDCQTYRLRTTGIRSDGTFSRLAMIPYKWQYLIRAPFRIGDKCCDVFKKRPARDYYKKTGRLPILGIRVDEGQQREQSWYLRGCNARDIKHPRSWPIAFWTADDVKEYIRVERISCSRLYDMGYERSGCMFCMFGAHLDQSPNRFQRLKKTHPAAWRYCMDKLGCRRVLEHLRIEIDEGPLLAWSTKNDGKESDHD